jgi:hypothetical protein
MNLDLARQLASQLTPILLCFGCLIVVLKLRRHSEMPADYQHPSEIAPDGCYADNQ